MNLNQTILDKCREEVAMEKGFSTWADCMYHTVNYTICFQFHEQAAELAMDRLAEFFRWLSIEDYCFFRSINVWSKEGEFPDRHYTELELYGIWEGQK